MAPNIFDEIPAELPDELATVLVNASGVRIERIVSRGHASPDDFWYDQDENEFVIVLKGRARLRYDNDGDAQELGTGDWADIPAHTRHRVAWTAPDEDTVWLAVFYN